MLKHGFFMVMLAMGVQAFGQSPLYQSSDSLLVDSLNLNRKIVPYGDRKETNVLYTGSDLVEDSFLGSWPMFGSELRMKIGGYVKVDMVYDLDGTLDPTQFLMSTIPVKGQPEYENSGYVNLFARETRFNIDVRRTRGKVPLKLFLEGDFWSAGNSFRLRHAYVVVGDFIIGQTWTTLSFLESLPFTIDFAAGDALFGGRSTQVRYQKKLNRNLQIGLAIENLGFLGIENSNQLPGKPITKLPIFAARLDYSWETGILFLGSSVGKLNWDGGANGTDASTLQYALVVAGRQYVGKKTYFTWNASYGQASGENIMAFAGSNANAVLIAIGDLERMPAFSALVGFKHSWTEKLATNVAYAYGWLEVPASRAPFALKDGGIGHVNFIYSPLDYLATGIEYMWGAQRTSNKALGRASRIQMMAKFAF